jgi:hypothetical protein
MASGDLLTHRNRDGDLTVQALKAGLIETVAIERKAGVSITRLEYNEAADPTRPFVVQRTLVHSSTATNVYRNKFSDIRRARIAFRKQAQK